MLRCKLYSGTSERQVKVNWYELLWFGSPTVQLASQYVWFCSMSMTVSCKGPIRIWHNTFFVRSLQQRRHSRFPYSPRRRQEVWQNTGDGSNQDRLLQNNLHQLFFFTFPSFPLLRSANRVWWKSPSFWLRRHEVRWHRALLQLSKRCSCLSKTVFKSDAQL